MVDYGRKISQLQFTISTVVYHVIPWSKNKPATVDHFDHGLPCYTMVEK